MLTFPSSVHFKSQDKYTPLNHVTRNVYLKVYYATMHPTVYKVLSSFVFKIVFLLYRRISLSLVCCASIPSAVFTV